MKTPQHVWAEVEQDPDWLEKPVAVVERIMREGFAAGHAAGVDVAIDGLIGHAAVLGRNLSLRLPPSVANGLLALADVMAQLPRSQQVLQRAWEEACQRTDLAATTFGAAATRTSAAAPVPAGAKDRTER